MPLDTTVTVRRTCSQRTNDSIIKRHLDFLTDRALAGNSGNGWKATISKTASKQTKAGWEFASHITFNKVTGHKNQPLVERQFSKILERLATAGQHTKFNKYPWIVLHLEHVQTGKKPENFVEAMLAPPSPSVRQPVVVSPSTKDVRDYYNSINLDVTDQFDEFYERESQIGVLMAALQAAKDSNLANRFNAVFFGPPGCGKTALMRALAKVLGEENQAYLSIDATSMTSAGMMQLLKLTDEIPPICFIEEVEKADENRLDWLMGVADIRGEIRRTNCRVGNFHKDVKMFCIASVNDMAAFKKMQKGALASRFPTEIYCPRPSERVMGQILQREVTKNNGRVEWIEPTIEYCMRQKGWTDPRKIIPVCLCGKDSLLDNSYQRMLDMVQVPADEIVRTDG